VILLTLINKVRTFEVVCLQRVVEVSYNPNSRVEYTGNVIDLAVEIMMLSGRNLLPNIMSIEVHTLPGYLTVCEIVADISSWRGWRVQFRL
jgi:hypothetical protein